MNRLKYSYPSTQWEDALPLGNGRLGCMVFGLVSEERIQLNEITLWAGEPNPHPDKEDAYKHLSEIRKLLNEKKYSEAGDLVNKEMTCHNGDGIMEHYGSYQTLGDIFIKMHEENAEYSDYCRFLDIDSAISGVSYKIDGVEYKREIFASAPANAIMCKISASEKGKISFTATVKRDYSVTYAENGGLVLRGQTKNTKSGDTSKGVIFEGRLNAVCNGGSITAANGELTVKDADEVVLIFAARTNYKLDQANGYKGKDPHDAVCKDIEKALKKTYEALKKSHIKEYKSFYGRNSVHFEGTDRSDLDTDERVIELDKGNSDNGLVELFYQFGRYLLISSSRPDNELPANLQGLWCKDYHAPWEADYHTNINVQMNYWPAGPTNLNDCTAPLARLAEACRENGRKTAKAYYNTDGWTVYTMVNPFGFTSPGWGGGWSQCVLDGAWLALNLTEYYAFSQDKKLLEQLWPCIRENCIFNIGILTEDENGNIITSPSVSPENTFRDDEGKGGWVCKGSTMDIEILWENFTSVIRICDILGCDDELKEKLKSLLPKLRKLQIGKEGQLCEWEGDWDMNAPEIHHRHISHIYGLYPGTMISTRKNPEFAEACRKSLEIRTDKSTGWSLAWKINCQARLHDGNHVYDLIKMLLSLVSEKNFNYSDGGGVYPNLFDAHPPFQIDGNFGASAGIAEMLLQSHVIADSGEYILDFLPALPDVLADGEAKGLKARGNFSVDIKWKDKKATKIKVKSNAGCGCAIYGKAKIKLNGKPVKSAFKDGITYFKTKINSVYEIIM